MKILKKATYSMIFLILFVGITSCSTNEIKQNTEDSLQRKNINVVLADLDWESVKAHNDLASYLIEKGYGYKTSKISGRSNPLRESLKSGSIDVVMEYWVIDKKTYENDINNDFFEELSINFNDYTQGAYIPRYMVEGDKKRGIRATAQGLTDLKDLLKYKDVFLKEGEQNPKIISLAKTFALEGQESWKKKLENYNITSEFKIIEPENGEELKKSAIKAYENGEPWIGYYWSPSSMISKYDFIRLKEAPYDKEIYETTGMCENPNYNITIVASPQLKNNAPEVYELLKNYKTSSEITNKLLSISQQSGHISEGNMKKFLRENEGLWKNWVTKEAYENIIKTIK